MRHFSSDRSGNFAMMWSILVVPLIIGLGLAVDYSRTSLTRAHLVNALDAGLLAAGKDLSATESSVKAVVGNWLNVHMADSDAFAWSVTSASVQSDGKLSAAAEAKLKPTFLGLIGHGEVTVKAVSEGVRSVGKVEIALVLDTTSSMSGSRITALKTVATKFVDDMAAMAGKSPFSNLVKISLVPYANNVNIGASNRGAPWLTGVQPAAYGADLFTIGSTSAQPAGFDPELAAAAANNRFRLLDQMGVGWQGCVESRPYPYDVNDDEPDAAKPATLFVPYFAPDEPDNHTDYENNYALDGISGTWQARQGNLAKYTTAPYSKNNPWGSPVGPNTECNNQPVVRLTADFAAVKLGISGLTPLGDTKIPLGAIWGWHTLSPNGPFADGALYDDPSVRKVMVLMTDGANTDYIPGGGDMNVSTYSSHGYIWQGRLGITSGTAAQRRAKLDERLAEICTNAKSKGIIIYSIAFQVSGAQAKNVLKNCASGDERYFDATNSTKLADAFNTVGKSLTGLRIVR